MTDNTSSDNHHSDDFVISSSWTLECESKSLRRTLTTNSSNESVDLEDIVQLDTCVHLIYSEETKNVNPCTISITVPESSTDLISRIVVVSEARIIELFGCCGAYLSSCTAEYLDDFEDCAVYLADCTIKPSTQVMIQFQKTKHPDSMWLYGINLRMMPSKYGLPAFRSINFQLVNEMLKEAKVPISENAEKCKAFLQAYSGGFQPTPPFKSKAPNPQMFMKMIEAGYLNPLGETGKNMSKCISNLVPFFSKEESQNNTMSDSSSGQTNSELFSDVIVLKNYFDQRFNQLENRIEMFEQKVIELEARQNEKLDCIIGLLNKANS